jgi:hypothetical protein
MSAHPSQLLGNTSDRNLGCTGVPNFLLAFYVVFIVALGW